MSVFLEPLLLHGLVVSQCLGSSGLENSVSRASALSVSLGWAVPRVQPFSLCVFLTASFLCLLHAIVFLSIWDCMGRYLPSAGSFIFRISLLEQMTEQPGLMWKLQRCLHSNLWCVNMFGFKVVHGAEIALQLPERWALQSQESLKL